MSILRALIWALRKARAALDRPLSIAELSALPIQVQPGATYRERVVIREFAWILADGCSTVYDIGASTGLYTRAFAGVTSIRHVVAFEPLHEVFSELQRNVGANAKVQCFNVGLGNQVTTQEMFRNEFSPSSSFLEMAETHVKLFPHTRHAAPETVELTTLDTVAASHALPDPDLIKIDVQGFEYQVLQGAIETIRRTKYIVMEVNLIELYSGMATFDELYRFLFDLDFEFRGVMDQLYAGDAEELVSVDVVFVNRKRRATSLPSAKGR